MLVLTRKQGERIHIGDGIVIKVIKSGKSTVKIGIEAPSDVRIMRAELCEQPTVLPKTEKSFGVPMTTALAALPVSDQFPHAV
jgi:carbon storage regulator CsrA